MLTALIMGLLARLIWVMGRSDEGEESDLAPIPVRSDERESR